MIEVGSVGPAFALPDQDGNTVILSRVLDGKSAMVVYFFPQPGAPGCTREALGFKEAMAALEARGVGVVGITTHAASDVGPWGREHGLPFPVCADADHTVAGEWGAWRGQGVGRMTFVLDGGGLVTHVFPRVDVNKHATDILELLGAASPAAVENAAQADETPRLGEAELIVALARSSLQLLLARADAGASVPDDVKALARRLADR